MDLDVHLPAIAAGDAEAFAAWLAGAEASVRGGLRSFAHVVDTEAVVQEALLRTWQVAPRVRTDGKGNSLLRFAVRVARNLAVDHARRSRAVGIDDEHLDLVADLDPPALPDPLLRELIARCRDRLPAQPAAALRARLDGGHDRDLAAKLDMKLNTFLKNVGRAKALLAECLRRHGVDVEGS